jgi:predicted regulator of Ras-like GTPase activity (Roadblock/LC7/MglB family)
VDSAQALADLTEISSQIECAVMLDEKGGVIASTLGDSDRTERVAEAAGALLRAVESAGKRTEPLVQLEVATLDGSVFVVRDQGRAVAAVTTPEPTVGLVFYDLKSCLRAAAAENDGKPRPRARQAAKKDEKDQGADDAA